MNTFRSALPADVAALARIHVTCWHESYDGLVPPAVLDGFSIERGCAVWGRILGEPSAFNAAVVYLAEREGALVGFGSCGSQRTAELAALGYAGEISSIYLLRAFQRQGLGSALMHTLAADLIGRGFDAGSLWVLRDNDRARRFYVRCGGRVVAERADVRENAKLFEVAYGWNSLADLRDAAGAIRMHPAPERGA